MSSACELRNHTAAAAINAATTPTLEKIRRLLTGKHEPFPGLLEGFEGRG
jgi:hypothetical protein